jgi:hypothetical protein
MAQDASRDSHTVVEVIEDQKHTGWEPKATTQICIKQAGHVKSHVNSSHLHLVSQPGT